MSFVRLAFQLQSESWSCRPFVLTFIAIRRYAARNCKLFAPESGSVSTRHLSPICKLSFIISQLQPQPISICYCIELPKDCGISGC